LYFPELPGSLYFCRACTTHDLAGSEHPVKNGGRKQAPGTEGLHAAQFWTPSSPRLLRPEEGTVQ